MESTATTEIILVGNLLDNNEGADLHITRLNITGKIFFVDAFTVLVFPFHALKVMSRDVDHQRNGIENVFTCGLGLVQDLTLTMTPPPQEALQGVLTVDQGLRKSKRDD